MMIKSFSGFEDDQVHIFLEKGIDTLLATKVDIFIWKAIENGEALNLKSLNVSPSDFCKFGIGTPSQSVHDLHICRSCFDSALLV